MRTVRSTKGAVNQGASSVSVIARRCRMKNWARRWVFVVGLLCGFVFGFLYCAKSCIAEKQAFLKAKQGSHAANAAYELGYEKGYDRAQWKYDR